MGEVALRMVATPASTVCSAQAIRVNGTTLFSPAWNRKRAQVARSCGSRMPRSRRMTARRAPAIRVRAAMKVSGGMVSTPTLMKV